MKKFNVFFIFLSLLIIVFSCKRKDQTPPKIFIEGDTLKRVIVQSYYDDEGATADDNFDADISARISIAYDISGLPSGITDWKNLEGYTNKTGEYTVDYSVTDEAGYTTTRSRNVTVYNEADKFAVAYTTKKTSNNELGGSSPDYAAEAMNVTSDTKTNNRMLLPKLSKISGLKIYGDIRDSLIISGTDTIIRKYIHIPVQTKRATQGTNVYDFTIQGVPYQSYFIDTLFFYKFRVSYNIDKTDTSGNYIVDDTAVEVYEKI